MSVVFALLGTTHWYSPRKSCNVPLTLDESVICYLNIQVLNEEDFLLDFDVHQQTTWEKHRYIFLQFFKTFTVTDEVSFSRRDHHLHLCPHMMQL